MTEPSPPVLRLRGVHKRFGARRVLSGVDLEIEGGEILALVGENGAGKSTLVHCIARSYPADSGSFEIAGRLLAADAIGVRSQGVAVVWQDLALCDNLSVVANLFLGHERLDRVLLDESAMAAEARALFARLGIPIAQLFQPVGSLSGGQRQLVAMARAVMHRPAILMLDEPTAALGVTEGRLVDRMLEQLRAGGTAVLLVSHRLEQVFNLADRIAVLRDGRIVAEVSPLEVHPDDVVAMISGVEADSTARRQLRRLRSLVDQLAEAGPAASLPLIVSAMAEALGVDQLCVHLLDRPDGGPARLRRSAAVGLRGPFLDAVESLPIGAEGGPPGLAAATGEAVVVEDTRNDPRWSRFRSEDRRGGPRSSWSVPITGAVGVLGTISGYAGTVGRPQAEQFELVSLYASHAAAAIDRERLLADATRRNRVLETLRGVLDSLAGPLPAQGGLAVALLALGRGLGADAIAFHAPGGERSNLSTGAAADVPAVAIERQIAAADALMAAGPVPLAAAADGFVGGSAGAADCGGRRWRRLGRAADCGGRRLVLAAGPVQLTASFGDDVLAVPIAAPDGMAVVTAWWADPGRPSADAAGTARRRGPIAAVGPGARGAGTGQRRGGVAAPFAAVTTRVPVPAQPRAAHPTDRHPRICLDAAPTRRDLGQLVPGSVPRLDRIGVGANGPPGGRPAGLQRHRLGRPAPGPGLVRPGPGARGGAAVRGRGAVRR